MELLIDTSSSRLATAASILSMCIFSKLLSLHRQYEVETGTETTLTKVSYIFGKYQQGKEEHRAGFINLFDVLNAALGGLVAITAGCATTVSFLRGRSLISKAATSDRMGHSDDRNDCGPSSKAEQHHCRKVGHLELGGYIPMSIVGFRSMIPLTLFRYRQISV